MVFNIGSGKTAVDLGSFHEMVFEHDETRKISVDLEWTLPKRLELTDSHAQKDYVGDRVRFSAEVGLPAKGPSLAVERLEYVFGNTDTDGFAVGMERTNIPKIPYELTKKNYDFVRNMGRKWPITDPVKCYGFPDEVVNYFVGIGPGQEGATHHRKSFRALPPAAPTPDCGTGL